MFRLSYRSALKKAAPVWRRTRWALGVTPNMLGGKGEIAGTASCRLDSKPVIYSEAFDQLVIRTSSPFLHFAVLYDFAFNYN